MNGNVFESIIRAILGGNLTASMGRRQTMRVRMGSVLSTNPMAASFSSAIASDNTGQVGIPSMGISPDVSELLQTVLGARTARIVFARTAPGSVFLR